MTIFLTTVCDWFTAHPNWSFRIAIIAAIAGAFAIELAVSYLLRRKIADWRDTLINVAMYAGYIAAYKALIWFLSTGSGSVWHPQRHPNWGAFATLFLLIDLAYYIYHWSCHRVRFMWASHFGHHTSHYFNLSTGLRQPWTPFFPLFFFLPLHWMGFASRPIIMAATIDLVYQIFLHTELIKSFGPLDWIFVSPSHHRVHHAYNPGYLDRNLGGVFIIWDRLFGTFARETEKPLFGVGADQAEPGVLGNSFREWILLCKELRVQLRI